MSPTRMEIEQMLADRLDFLMGVGHDMRVPLTGIAGFATVLSELESTLTDPTASEAVAYICKEASRLVDMLNQLLYFGQVEQGMPHLEIEALDLGRLARQAMEPFAALNPSLTFHLVQNGETMVDGDFLKLHRVLGNLIDNAVKHSPPAGQITVEVGSNRQDAWMAVTDQGEGVAAADRDRIFDRFVRLNSRHRAGAGIGLYIVKGLVGAHGGSVTLEEADGSRFVVRLPLRADGIDVDEIVLEEGVRS